MLKNIFVVRRFNKHSAFMFETSIVKQITGISEPDLMFNNVNIFLTRNFFLHTGNVAAH